MKHSKLKLC